MKTLVRYFLRGCLVLVPLSLTLYIIWFVLSSIDSLIKVGIPGLGFVLTLGLITLVGFLTSSVLGRTVFSTTEKFFTRLPLVKLIYTSIKDLVSAVVGDRRRFDTPVAVEMAPGSGIKALGFVTRHSLGYINVHGCVAVYFPQSYNFAGNVLIVPRERMQVLEASTADLMTFIVSGGVSGLGVGQTGESLIPGGAPGQPAAAGAPGAREHKLPEIPQGDGPTLVDEEKE